MVDYRLHAITWKKLIDYNWLPLQITIFCISNNLIFPDKYNHIESELIKEFTKAHTEGDQKKMKRVAMVLSNFKVYLIDYIVEEKNF
jgi:hypothetical protein